ncbi:hypothetical protein BJ170DRAFT_711090 [Xylariales sp. AK1849]|nr:hypothetical protein BJ170DRAFT_711090 [Xylariales sp. AK1849]
MKISIFLLTLGCVLTGTMADFWFFTCTELRQPGGPAWYYFYKFMSLENVGGGHPNCTEVVQTPKIMKSSDVSGDKWCVRFQGPPNDPEVIEWNSRNAGLGHYTIYKDRDYGIFSLADEKVGKCRVDNSYSYEDCITPPGVLDWRQSGVSVVYCETSVIVVPPIHYQSQGSEIDDLG